MSKNRRDQILNMAFGETDTDGMAYESLSENERAELETLKGMREGLKSLSDVPECQLSPERLRSAILGNAVKKRPAQSWGFATGTIAFVAVALIAFQAGVFDKDDLNIASSTAEISNTDIVDTIDISGSGSSSDYGDILANATGTSETGVSTAPNSEVLSDPGNFGGSDASRESDWGTYALNNRSGNYGPLTPIVYYPIDEDVEVTLAVIPGEDEISGPLVVVDNSVEDMYGSYVATEVETFGDVVFGG